MERVQEHNREIRRKAEWRAKEMQSWPSPLEEKMKDFLDRYNVEYEFQKIFYIYADDGWIVRYYIADFYLPEKKIIIEVDGKQHDMHKQYDKERTGNIQENYPNVTVLRYRWEDLSDENKMEKLLYVVM